MVQHLIATFGYLAILLLMTVESAAVPVPSEVIMPFAGALAATGRFNIVAVILLGTAGNVVGSYIAWAIGRAGGPPLIRRFGKYVLLKERDLDRAEAWFGKRGEGAVLVSRMLPVVRGFISFPAGAARMQPMRFGLYTALGSLPWSAGLAVAGYELGKRWSVVASAVTKATDVVAVVVALALAAGIYALYRRKRNPAQAAPSDTGYEVGRR